MCARPIDDMRHLPPGVQRRDVGRDERGAAACFGLRRNWRVRPSPRCLLRMASIQSQHSTASIDSTAELEDRRSPQAPQRRRRMRRFFRLAAQDAATRQLLIDLNNRFFKKLPGCRRRSAMEALDLPCLRPLLAARYAIKRWMTVKVDID